MSDEARLAVARRINGERLVLLGWSRAILLQLAHPLIAAGVYDHSGFRASPAAAIGRLRATVRAMLAIAFGDDERRERALAGIRAIHRRVNGVLPETVGVFPAGTPYSAEDPALLLWVHTTLIESTVLSYERFISPLSEADRDAYCAASAPVPIALGAIVDDVPRTWRALVALNDLAVETDTIIVGRQAQELAGVLMGGAATRIVPPAGWLNRLVTIGLLPPPIREQYGLEWSDRRARTFERVAVSIRRTRRVAPDAVARFGDARRSGPLSRS